MFRFKGKLLHVKKMLGGNPQNCEWFTFINRQEVPFELVDLVRKQGGEVEEVKSSSPESLPKLEPNVEPEVEFKWDYASLKKLTRNEQITMLKQLGSTNIPSLEGGRINLILELLEVAP